MVEDVNDGPDVVRARERLEEVRATTGEHKVIVAETKQLTAALYRVERRDHFTEKIRAIIQGT